MEDHAHGQQKGETESLKKIFHLFDKDGDGRITADELTTVLRSIERDVSKKELQAQVNKIMRDGDKDKNGTIDFEEFQACMESRMGHQSPLKKIKDAFHVFDCDGDGFIERDELKSVMLKLGDELTDTQVDSMIKDADLDGNGKIDFEEFFLLMSK
ncbi:calmodulin-beta-like [Pecten maximus]|uniref:calmodulin-beta-like n=1 Tax=Pecten maximus TaxID=6579 RepID=UPI0014583391|nr:calmodulin-beta-like [Pecten maximus]